jgi:microcystin-dependent protein
MSTPFLGEVKMVSFNFAPKGWALCNGQFLPINQNQALFSLFGTMYGGNGQTTFALPDLRDRTALHVGTGFTQGQAGGEAAHTLNISEMPAHTHGMNGSSTIASQVVPTGGLLGVNAVDDIFATTLGTPAVLSPGAVTNVGGSQAHSNLQPYLTLNFCVALQGIFPSRN